jgi:hypothetical protein
VDRVKSLDIWMWRSSVSDCYCETLKKKKMIKINGKMLKIKKNKNISHIE